MKRFSFNLIIAVVSVLLLWNPLLAQGGPEPVFTEHEFVDMGLSVMWATCNVGANSETTLGDLYAWGDITPRKEFNEKDYRFGKNGKLTKYCFKPSTSHNGAPDMVQRLSVVDDAASVNWGEDWRMPTGAELEELVKYSNWRYVSEGGRVGYEVTSVINGNVIFLPAKNQDVSGYWSSDLLIMDWSVSDGNARALLFDAENVKMKYAGRAGGNPVRPVYDGKKHRITGVDFDAYQKMGPVELSKARYHDEVRGEIRETPAEHVVNSAFLTSGKVGSHDFVDMGNGIYMATVNLGASKVGEVGDTYMWAETSPKKYDPDWENSKPDWTRYKYADYVRVDFLDSDEWYSKLVMTKYNSDGIRLKNGKNGRPQRMAKLYPVDYWQQIHPEDDAASVLWGKEWRIPTEEEMEYLRDKCFVEEHIVEGKEVLRFTSPETGGFVDFPWTRKTAARFAEYWTSTRLYKELEYAYAFTMWENMVKMKHVARCRSFYIRPVLSSPPQGAVRKATKTVTHKVRSKLSECVVGFVSGWLHFNSIEWKKTRDGNLVTYSNGEVAFEMMAVESASKLPGYHKVTKDFCIGVTEVTEALWKAVMAENPDEMKDGEDKPVINVTYKQCLDFISRLNAKTGESFRLPTPEEWEFAARGGLYSQNYKYSGGDKMKDVGYYRPDGWPQEVAKYRPNELGLYDMSGNVWEICDKKGYTNRGVECVWLRGGSYCDQNDWTMNSGGSLPLLSWSHDAGLRLASDCDFQVSPVTVVKYENGIKEAKPFTKSISEGKIVFSNGDVSFTMISVPGGTYKLGDMKDKKSEKYRQHKVALSPFYIGEFEVTQELWEAVMGSNPSRYEGGRMPVTNVSYDDCLAFVEKLRTLTGSRFNLPSEAQWECAARGGALRSMQDLSGADEDDYATVAWTVHNNTTRQPHKVGQLKPNSLGLYDMSGNVSEWCLDSYHEYPSKGVETDPVKIEESVQKRMTRGGHGAGSAYKSRVWERESAPKTSGNDFIGLRLIMTE